MAAVLIVAAFVAIPVAVLVAWVVIGVRANLRGYPRRKR